MHLIGVHMFRPLRRIIGGILLAVLIAAPAHALKTTEFIPTSPEQRCYGTVLTPATYEKRLTRVEVSPAYQHQRQISAIVEHQRLHVQTKEAAIAYQTHAPVYSTVYDQVLIEPERQIEVFHPAQYATSSEIIEIEPAKTVWKPCTSKFGRDAVRSAMNTTGARQKRSASVLCRTPIPAKERIVQSTRLERNAWTETKTVPARYKTVARQVVNRPAYAQKVVNQPEYTGISIEHELVPARYEIETIPATYQEQIQDVVVSGNELVQAEILCDRFATRAHVRKIQTALVARGYEIRIDGIYGPETQGAMEQFQADQKLAKGYMTVESITELGLSQYACPTDACMDSRSQRTVMATQRALSAAGYFAASDGIHGPQTQAALEQFQRDHGLAVGYLSAESMLALDIHHRI